MKVAIKYDPERVSYKEILARWTEDHNIAPEEIENDEKYFEDSSKGLKGILQGLKDKIFGPSKSSKLLSTILPLPITLSQILTGELTIEQLFNRMPSIKKAFENAEERTFKEVKSISNPEDVYAFLANFTEELDKNDVNPEKGIPLIETARKYMISQFSEEVRKEESTKYVSLVYTAKQQRQDDPRLMIELCNLAIDWDETNATAYLFRFLYEEETDIKQAKQDIEKAIELNPHDSQLKHIYVSFLERYKKEFDIKSSSMFALNKFLMNMVRNSMNKKEENVALAKIDKKTEAQAIASAAYKKYLKSYNASALAYYNQAIAEDPTKAEYYYERALVKQNAFSDYLGASEDLMIAMELDPANADFYMEEAEKAISINNLREEEADKYKALIEYKMNNEEYESALKDLDKAIEINPNSDYYYLLRSNIHFFLGHLQEAFENINKAIELNPKEYKHLVNLSSIDMARGDLLGALEALDKAISFKSDDGYLYFARAQMKYVTHDLKGAFLDCRESLKYDDKNHFAHFLMSSIKHDFEDYKGALDSINRAIELNEEDPFYYTFRAKLRFGFRDYDGAMEDYDTAISIDPDNSYFYYLKAKAYYTLDQFEDALTYINKGLLEDPADENLYVLMADVYDELKDYEASLEAADKAISLDENLDFAYYQRGSAKVNLGDLEGALKDLNTAISKNYRNPEYFAERGTLKLELNNLSEALLDLSYAISMNPENPEYYYLRGRVWEAKGNIRDAKKDYEMACKLDPENQVYIQALSKLSN